MRPYAQLLAKAASTLCIITLIIGPLILGSYYGQWRLPLLYCAAGTSVLTFFYCVVSAKRKWSVTSALLVLCVLVLCAQGLFMWYNSWGTLHVDISDRGHYSNWQLTPLAQQPFYYLPGSADASEAFDRLSYIIPALCFLLSVRSLLCRRVLSLRHLCSAIFWTGAAVGLLGLVQRFTGAESIFWCDALINPRQALFFGTFRSPGIAACYLNLTLSIGLSHLLATIYTLSQKRNARPTKPIFLTIGVVITLTAAATAGSKAGVAFTGLTLILWGLLNFKALIKTVGRASSLLPSGSPHERNIIITAVLAVVTLSTLSFGGLVYQRWEYAKTSDFGSLETRKTANQIQIDMIADPQWDTLAGFGPGSFYPLFPFYQHGRTVRGKPLSETLVYSHNDHLQTLVEWGWLGTGCFILLIGGGGAVMLVEQFAHRKKHRTHHLYYFRGITVAMLVCLLHATVDFPFQIESIAITFAAVLGAGGAARQLRINNE